MTNTWAVLLAACALSLLEAQAQPKLPACSFYLFGMGERRKLLYKEGVLLDARTGETVRKWEVARETIRPAEYSVRLELAGGGVVTISEDEKGVWLAEGGHKTSLAASRLKLPRFQGHSKAALLRILHQEILVNIVDGKPVPNLFVYSKPWYRDGALVCMCLQKTGNLRLVKDWILGLREPFDRNNAGQREPDNLGEALYLISLVSDASHPLVRTILDTIPQFRKGNYIVGSTDFAEHPVYQTKWLKFGLRALRLDDPYEIPAVFDSYSALFWMDYKTAHVEGPGFSQEARELYPYLGWAEAHSHGWPPPMTVTEDRYPLTWEAQASQANYAGMGLVSEEYVQRRICAPHTWHAAEMFLYLLEQP